MACDFAKKAWLTWPLLLLAGCNPSWSPDGKRVLFPYIRQTQQASGVALYDCESGKAIELLPAAVDRTVQAALFSEDGKEAIVVCAAEAEDESAEVMVLGLPAGRIGRRFAIASRLDAPYAGFAVAGGRLLYSPMATAEDDGEKAADAEKPPAGLRCLNLRDGSIERLFTDRLLTVATAGKSLAYIETVPQAKGRDIAIRCGWLDIAGRELIPLASLTPQDLGWQTAIASPVAFAAAAGETPRFAFIAVPGTASAEDSAAKIAAGEYTLVVMDGKGDILLKKRGRSSYWLRFLCLSADGRRLFTPEIREDICGLRDIDVATGEEVFIPLVERVSLPPRQSARTPAVLTTVGLSLSADQRMLAVNTQFRFADPPPASLYLLELADRGARHVKPIRLPEQPSGK